MPVDLYDIYSGDEPTDPKLTGARTDGVGLFYAGHMNLIFGPGGSAKTWTALYVAREFIRRGRHVYWLTFEKGDQPKKIAGRLARMGVPREDALQLLHIYRPGELPDTEDVQMLNDALLVIDPLNSAMSHLGITMTDMVGGPLRFAEFVDGFLDATNDMTVLLLDHTGKDTTGGRKKATPIGGQAKMTSVELAYFSEVVRTPEAGRVGHVRLWCVRDQASHIRPGAVTEVDGGYLAADIIIHSDDQSSAMTVELHPPGVDPDQLAGTPTLVIETALKDGPLSLGQLRKVVGGRAAVVDAAAAQLVQAGVIEVVAGPRGAKLHQLTGNATLDGPEGGQCVVCAAPTEVRVGRCIRCIHGDRRLLRVINVMGSSCVRCGSPDVRTAALGERGRWDVCALCADLVCPEIKDVSVMEITPDTFALGGPGASRLLAWALVGGHLPESEAPPPGAFWLEVSGSRALLSPAYKRVVVPLDVLRAYTADPDRSVPPEAVLEATRGLAHARGAERDRLAVIAMSGQMRTSQLVDNGTTLVVGMTRLEVAPLNRFRFTMKGYRE